MADVDLNSILYGSGGGVALMLLIWFIKNKFKNSSCRVGLHGGNILTLSYKPATPPLQEDASKVQPDVENQSVSAHVSPHLRPAVAAVAPPKLQDVASAFVNAIHDQNSVDQARV